MSLLQAAPGQAPWVEAWPPGALPQLPCTGLASGWGSSNSILGRVNGSLDLTLIRVFCNALCLAPHPGPICQGRPYQEAKAA